MNQMKIMSKDVVIHKQIDLVLTLKYETYDKSDTSLGSTSGNVDQFQNFLDVVLFLMKTFLFTFTHFKSSATMKISPERYLQYSSFHFSYSDTNAGNRNNYKRNNQ